MTIKVILADEFKFAAKRLRKRYPNVMRDLNPFLTQLENGELLGDRIQGLAPYRVYKARIRNSDAQRGKSGGYRVVYYLESEEQTILLTIYSKTDQSDIPSDVLRHIIAEYIDQHQ
jgi:mRNA-degrading endonuclease RelE of RelBE toxin-antitoxin system